MEKNQKKAVVVSVTLHALLAAIVFFTTYYWSRKDAEPVKIFELVAGPPTNIYSTEAPKKGNKTVTFDLPEIEEMPEDSGDEPMPVVETVEETPPAPPVKATPPPTITPPKLPAKTQPKPAEKPKTTAKPKTENPPKKITFDEFAKKNPNVKKPAQSTKTGTKTAKANYKKVDVAGIADGVRAGSLKSTGGGGGKALTREEQDRMDTYISFLVQEIRRAAEQDSAGISDDLLAKVTFDVSPSGAISNPRIQRSSGSRDFDEFALNVFRRMKPVGPTPDRKAHTWTVNFTMNPNA